MQWFANAPSNIALVKYMGKKDERLNLPDNASLSYTLDKLLSSVSLERQPGSRDFWEPLIIPGAESFQLSKNAQLRFLNHLDRIKKLFGYEGSFLVKSTTNFPQGAGLASSASSFAALTKCALLAISEIQGIEAPSNLEAAKISRLGSGSSCRSFFSPWALWQDEDVGSITLPYQNLLHEAILISHEEKKIPSSEAHQRVKTAKSWPERAQRAEERLAQLLKAFQEQNWVRACQICQDEFEDMHHLFETCEQPFSYMTENSRHLLKTIEKFRDKLGDGPIVTMDAGPNIHLLYRPDQESIAREFKNHYLLGNYDIL